MKSNAENVFEPQAFLHKVGEGKPYVNTERTRSFLRREISQTRLFTFKKAGSRFAFCLTKARMQ
jgi:hypothetical protein